MKNIDLVLAVDDKDDTFMVSRNPFNSFGISNEDCKIYYREIFGDKTINSQRKIDKNITGWIFKINEYNKKIINKYNKNAYVSSVLLAQKKLFDEYNNLREFREDKRFDVNISELFLLNSSTLETTSRIINIFIEEAIKDNNFGLINSYFSDDEIYRLIVYFQIYYVLTNYLSRKKIGKTPVKILLHINPNDINFYSMRYLYFNTWYTKNGAMLPYDIDESKNEDLMDKITQYMYGLKYKDTIFGLYVLSILPLENDKLGVNTLRIDDVVDFLKYQFKDINFAKFLNSIVLNEKSISIEKKDIYKRHHRNKLELCPLILLNNYNFVVSQTLMIRSIEYLSNVMKNGIQPFSDINIKKIVDQIVERNSKQMVNDTIKILSKKYPESIIKRSVKSKEISDNGIDYGDYDIICYIPNKRKVFTIEVKYISSSFENSGLENDLKKIFSKNGYADKFKNRNILINNNISKLKDMLNIDLKKIICVEPIFLSSKPIQMPLVSFEYEGFFINYDMLIDFIEDRIEYERDLKKFLKEIKNTLSKKEH